MVSRIGGAGLLLVGLQGLGADFVTPTWDANAETDLVGYRVYAGTNSGSYQLCIPTELVTAQHVALPVRTRWYIAVTATNRSGLESGYSNEAQVDLTAPKPSQPHVGSWVRLTPIIARSTNLRNWVSVAGTPTWFPATNRQEFFITRGLEVEPMQRMVVPEVPAGLTPPQPQGESWVRVTPIIARSTDLTNWVNVAGAPTWFPATDRQEIFIPWRLEPEPVQGMVAPAVRDAEGAGR